MRHLWASPTESDVCLGPGLSTLITEIAGIHRSTGTGPGSGSRLRLLLSAISAEITGIDCSAETGPRSGCLLLHVSRTLLLLHRRLLRILVLHRCALSSHLIELRRVGAACLRRHVHPHKGHRRSGIGIGSSCLHCLCLCADQGRSCKGSISKRCRFLHLLDRLFIFRIGGDAGNAEGNNFDASLLSPLLAKNLVQGVSQLQFWRKPAAER